MFQIKQKHVQAFISVLFMAHLSNQEILRGDQSTNPLISTVANTIELHQANLTPIEISPTHNNLGNSEINYTKEELLSPRIEDESPSAENQTVTSGQEKFAELPSANSSNAATEPSNQLIDLLAVKTEDTSSNDQNSLIGRTQTLNLKRRQTEQSVQSSGDWWSKFSAPKATKSTPQSTHTDAPKQAAPRKRPEAGIEHRPSSAKRSGSHEETSERRNVYKAQPLNQNALLTIRYQLSAIRSKHKTLVTKSIPKLQQLDNKLVDSYKLCLKRNMPLYAGMLYRTRDFVVKMAKEVKHEKKVLESMSKQVRGVLKQKMTNRTLVREYNKLIGASKEPAEDSDNENVQVSNAQQGVKMVATKIASSSSRAKKDSPFDETQQQDAHKIEDSNEAGSAQSSAKKLSAWNKRSNSSKSDTKGSTSDLLAKIHSRNNFDQRQHEQESESTTKKSKAVWYTVSVNEYNLKKELNKIQALIDRIDGSSSELSTIVDDIVYLFKLTSDLQSKRGKFDKMFGQMIESDSRMTAEQKRAKKMFKSPIRVFLEKYGKLTMATNSGNMTPTPNQSDESTINSNNSTRTTNSETTSNYSTTETPEIKPLFDSSSLTLSELADQELGFDYVTSESERFK